MKKIIFSVFLALTIMLWAQEESFEQTIDQTTSSDVVTEKSDEIAASDENKHEKAAKPATPVAQKKDAVELPQGKVTIAVLNLDNSGEFTEAEIKLFTDRVNSGIVKVNRFLVVERQQIDEILKEQGFQQSGACSNQECLMEVGQLLAVQKVISGSVGKMENIYPVSLKVVDVKTGEVDAQIVEDYKGSKSKLLSECIPAITEQLLRKAGYLDKGVTKKKKLVAKPGFWIPTLAVVAGGAAAAILLTRDKSDDGDEAPGKIDISNFPDHVIPVQ